MPLRLLHTADLHLGAPLKGFGPLATERRRDLLTTFERIIELAVSREVDCLVVAGDLFDANRIDGETVGRVQKGFERLAGHGIPTVLIPGTHDNVVSRDALYRTRPFAAKILMEPTVTEPLRLTLRGCETFFYGFAYRSDGSRDALATMKRRRSEGIHIGLLHGSLQGSPEWELRCKDLPFTPADLAALQLDYLALGHYHSYAPLEQGGRLIACYPGSPEGKKFGENGPRHVALVEVEPGTATLEKVEVQTRIVAEPVLDASLAADAAALEAELARLGRPDLIARVRLTGTVEEPLDLANLAGRLQGLFAGLELVDETDLYDSGFVRHIEREESIRGLFARKMAARLARASDESGRQVCREALRLAIARLAGRGES
jgi:DNA repair exonuclease SbcCD nuclease subunit